MNLSRFCCSSSGFFCLLLLLVCAPAAHAQVSGCKDPAASNYNASATVNDGSCIYNSTVYIPPVKVDPLSTVLEETSGLQWAGNSLWSFNDGGHDAVLFRVDTASAAIIQTVILDGAINEDWEDIGFDGTHLYIGDFGNNLNGARTNLRIYKFPVSAIPDPAGHPVVTIPASQIEKILFSYSDQPQPPVASGTNNTRFDCEAMVVDGGKIHLFTKNWVDASTTHYVIDGTAAGSYVATPVETLNTGYLVTAADKAPGTEVIVLIGYQNSGLGMHYMHLLSDYRNGLYFNGNKRRIDLRDATIMGQVEGITFRNGLYGYISNEKFERTAFGITLTVQQKLRSFTTDAFLPAYTLASALKNFDIRKEGRKHRLSWVFSEAVKDLKLEWGANRSAFTVLQTYERSASGDYLHQPAAAENCYRLSWQGAGGQPVSSKIICLDAKGQVAFSNFLLRSNGELSFLFDGDAGRDCIFRLHATDGRLIAQTPQQMLTPGGNTIRFQKRLPPQAILLLQAIGSEDKKSLLLRVE